MGGQGSGRSGSNSAAHRCEDYHAIDLSWLKRQGILASGHPSSVNWSRGGRPTGTITVCALPEGLQLRYRIRRYGEEWQDVAEVVPFVWTPTPFGGRRQWLQCPKCGRGCRVIYGGSQFRCRRCWRLRYSSQYEAAHQRALDQADKLRKRVGGNHSAVDGDEFPPKPKRMRWSTYWRLEELYTDLQNRWAAEVTTRLRLR